VPSCAAAKANTDEEIDYVIGHGKTRIESIQRLLHQKKCLGRFGKLNYNKITFLEVCKELSIPIPKSLFTTRKKEFVSFLQIHEEVIVKSIANNFHHRLSMTDESEIWQKGTTHLLKEKDIDQIPETFSLSLFQEKLEKEYEVRILYLAGKIFSQAIFSQTTDQSKIDYREGLGDTQMRQCNYLLPPKIQNSIPPLMDALGLNIGCIDVVKTLSGEYVFLEVNPSGIFTDMMDHCNYDMHFEIAKFLKDEE
jgi:glutathione synthase/RimK-type ligase-like ATP-grasp enzyme